jgi:hypothetical protein
MRRVRFVQGVVVASLLGFAVAGCGGSGGGSGYVPLASQNGNVAVSALTVQPTTITMGQSVNFNYTLSNPGHSSSSNITLQAFVSTQEITLQNYTSNSVTALGTPTTVSSVGGNSSSSGTLSATMTAPSIHTPTSAFVAVVAIPSSSAGSPQISSNVGVSLK